MILFLSCLKSSLCFFLIFTYKFLEIEKLLEFYFYTTIAI